MIIDTHIHLYDPMRAQGVPWPDPENTLLYRTTLPAHIKAQAVPDGVTGAVVVEASAWLEDNQWVLELAADEPFIVGLVGRVEPGAADFAHKIDRFAENPLFRGIRFWSPLFKNPERSSLFGDMEKLAERDLVLDIIFPNDDADGFFELVRRLPELRIMIEHIANVTIDGKTPDRRWTDLMHSAAEFPQVSMKVSALIENSTVKPAPPDVEFYTPTLDVLWEAFGEDRLVYGSNWPVCEGAGTYARCIDIVRTYFSGKGEEASEKYFWKNAKRIYKWIER